MREIRLSTCMALLFEALGGGPGGVGGLKQISGFDGPDNSERKGMWSGCFPCPLA